ncbi:Flp pilus assembly protein CpaB [Agromyces indicus]|uniref:RcpC/CpaB family pilus assembly protein n=1 Tax=Agromyces indicus TaxID=758919 RepID=A0ABU1FH15_9MICO|nr:RcpC/CpaB family pilus assembly protein [Agromyces indicus]MDR5691039.1 RcpC/CpaB family pilus assembly protein [Agromyces indicus]
MKTRIIGAIVALLLAVVGAFVLVNYVQAADARAAAGAELSDVYIVEEEIPQGTPGEEVGEFVTVDQVPARNLNEDRVTDLADLQGLVALDDVLPGEQLLNSRFSDPAVLNATGEIPVPEGLQEVTIALPVERVVGGQVSPGSTVGVVYSTNTNTISPNSNVAVTKFMFHRMLVTRVTPGTTVASDGSSTNETSAGTIMVTFAATTPQVERLVYGAEQQADGNGGLWLTLEPETADPSGSSPRFGQNIYVD